MQNQLTDPKYREKFSRLRSEAGLDINGFDLPINVNSSDPTEGKPQKSFEDQLPSSTSDDHESEDENSRPDYYDYFDFKPEDDTPKDLYPIVYPDARKGDYYKHRKVPFKQKVPLNKKPIIKMEQPNVQSGFLKKARQTLRKHYGSRSQPTTKWCAKNKVDYIRFRLTQDKYLKKYSPRAYRLDIFTRLKFILDREGINTPSIPKNYYACTNSSLRFARRILSLTVLLSEPPPIKEVALHRRKTPAKGSPPKGGSRYEKECYKHSNSSESMVEIMSDVSSD